MNIIMKIFGYPLGWVMHYLYKWIGNYGIALLIFTMLTRLIMIPITIRQQKSTAQMSSIQPKTKELQSKYGHDQQLYNEKLNELYADEGVNPMGGCLPMLVQFPILFGLIDVIYRPLTHIIRLPETVMATAGRIFQMLGFHAPNVNTVELSMISAIREKPLFFGALGTTAIAQINELNFNFLGMNLMIKPEWEMLTGIFKGQFNPVVLIPIISGITAFMMSYFTTQQQSATGGDQAGAGMMKGMMLTMPLMSVWIAFTVPAGVGLYWIYSNLAGMVQTIFINKFYNPKDLLAKEEEIRTAKRDIEREERMEARRKLKAGLIGEENAHKALTPRELDRLQLAAARERDAKKYGEPEDGYSDHLVAEHMAEKMGITLEKAIELDKAYDGPSVALNPGEVITEDEAPKKRKKKDTEKNIEKDTEEDTEE